MAATHYQYGAIYVNKTPAPVQCTGWNVGTRIANANLMLVLSDDPSAPMELGGYMFYTGTAAADDDTCPPGQWRHRYWSIRANSQVIPNFSNGCADLQLWCRKL